MGTTGLQATTVRSVLATAELAPRYFYESFANIDALVVEVFEGILREMIAVGQAAVADTGPGVAERVRAGLDAVARLLTDDPRKGRVLLIESAASTVLAPRRRAAIETLARLVAEHMHGATPAPASERPVDHTSADVTARFLVGGFSETVAALVRDPDRLELDAVIGGCTELFLACVQVPPGSVVPPPRTGDR